MGLALRLAPCLSPWWSIHEAAGQRACQRFAGTGPCAKAVSLDACAFESRMKSSGTTWTLYQGGPTRCMCAFAHEEFRNTRGLVLQAVAQDARATHSQDEYNTLRQEADVLMQTLAEWNDWYYGIYNWDPPCTPPSKTQSTRLNQPRLTCPRAT